MKLSTYLMIGAFAVGLAACVGVTLWINTLLFKPATTVELSGESVDQPAENFSAIEFSVPYSGDYYYNNDSDRRYSVTDSPAKIKIVESDSVSRPVITTYPVLADMISISVENGTLNIAYSPENMPAAEGEFIKYVNTIDIPVTVTVPRGMLKTLNGKASAKFVLDTLEADSIEIDADKKLIIDNSKIGVLSGSLSDALIIRNNTEIAECRLTISDDDLSLKTENGSHIGIVKLVDFKTDLDLDIDEASIDEISVNEAIKRQLNSSIRRDVKVTSFTE